jgi:hypothetical protein
MPVVRSQLLDTIRDAYPEKFEGVTPTTVLGERVFSRPTPHPNEVLNLFVQQGLASALPMAYYMAAQKGLNSLLDRHLPQNAALSPEVLKSAAAGLLVLREFEVGETHCLVMERRNSNACSSLSCPSRNTTGPRVSDAHKKVIERITGSPQSGTKILQVLSLRGITEGDPSGFCKNCLGGWEDGHVEIRKRAWDMLPYAFGLTAGLTP